MPDNSPTLALPYLMPSQAQKHVTHNEALQRLDALVQLSVAGTGAQTPPVAPDPGETHALGAAPTGAWAGQAGALAIWNETAWQFIPPQQGWRAWDRGTGELRIWDGTGWVRPQADLTHVEGVGIATAPDSENRLAVKAPASLFSHDGDDHQVKINKAAPGDTASVLFQSGWGGRAEIGLTGSDDLSVKVSPDGAAWTEALRINSANGRLTGARIAAEPAANAVPVSAVQTHASASKTCIAANVHRPATPDFDFLTAHSGNSGDLEFRLAGDGNGSCDGAWSGGGADYAEYFEWSDANPQRLDRRGVSVVLEGHQIRPARPGDQPIGVISANPSLVGDAAPFRWAGKYLRDDFGTPLHEAYEIVEWADPQTGMLHSFAADALPDGVVVPINARRRVQHRRRLNPAHDPARPYLPRAARPEWDMVGLLGKLRLRRGQPTARRWLRLGDVAPDVEEWLVR